MTGIAMPMGVGVGPTSRPATVDRTRGRAETVALQVALALTLLFVVTLGFAGYLFGLSGVSEQRAQTNLRKSFAAQLSLAVAPVGPTADGKPMAVVSVPRLGLDNTVVVQGTSSRDLADGPGHRPDTAFPGQPGVSVFYGRRLSFGGPFAHLMRLEVGDPITVVSGQGTSVYRVSSFGDSKHPAPANSANRLVLITADTSGVPHGIESVSADLVSAPKPSNGVVGQAARDEQGLVSGVDSSLLPTLLWSQALLILAIGAVVAAHRWSPVATYLCVAPVALAVLWNLYENLALLMPNLY